MYIDFHIEPTEQEKYYEKVHRELVNFAIDLPLDEETHNKLIGLLYKECKALESLFSYEGSKKLA